MGLSLRNLGKKIENVVGATAHGLNPFDNGQGWTNQAPQSQQVNPNVVSAIQGAKYGVLANNPQAQQRFLGSITPGHFNPITATPQALGGAIKSTIIIPGINTLKLPANLASFGAAELTGNNPAITKSTDVLQNNAINSFIGMPAQTAVFTGASLAANKILDNPNTSPEVKQAQIKDINAGFAPAEFNTADKPGKVALKALNMAAQDVSYGVPAVPKAVKASKPLNEVGAVGKNVGKTGFIGKIPENRPAVVPKKVQITPAKNGTLQILKKGLSDSDQVILDELRNIEKTTGQKGLVNRFMYNSNMQRGSNAGANVALQTSPNIQKAIGGLSKNDYKSFSDYANARTELSTAGKGKTSLPLQALQAKVANASPEFQARFDALNEHYKDLADKALEAGLISPETHAKYVANNNYIRIQRDMGDLLPSVAQGRGNSYSIGKTVLSQKRKGSSREILPAGETAAEYTQQIYHEAAKNKTGTQLVDTLSQYGLAQKLKNASDATHKNSVTIIRNGKNEYYEVSPQMKEAIQNINPYQMNAVMQILAAPGRVLRAGVTGLNPVFIARNLVKDQAGSAINSEALRATHNPASFFSGLWNASKGVLHENHDPLWQDFLKHYGDQTSYDLTRNVKNTQAVVNRIRGGKIEGVKQMVKSPVRSLEDLASITEKSTRFQNYRGAYKRAISEGLSKEQASEKAAIQAWQNSVDFSRAGDWGRVINTVVPYWNPATQGVRQMARTFTKHPVKSTFTGTAVVGLPIATATAWNLSNPDTAKIYANIPEYEKDNNLILIPPGTKQNQDGTYDVVKIPLPPGYKDAFMPVRRALEAYHNQKPVEGQKIAQDILQTVGGPVNYGSVGGFAGSFLPQAAKPFVQQYANKDLFSGKTIVPDYINQAVDANGNPVPENQKAYKYSSGTARAIGNTLGVSPIRVEKFIKDTGGTVGLNVLNAVDTARANLGQIPREQIGGQSVNVGLKRSFGQTQGIKNENASPGAKYFDSIKKATSSLNGNELAAFNSLHPQKKNFLGDVITETSSVYNPAARLDIYNRYPKVFQADKQLDAQQKYHNPLYSLDTWQVKKVLEKDNLPPGAKDPELSKLYTQPWYQDYQAQKSKYYSAVNSELSKSGKSLGTNDNPYPTTPAPLQKIMDYYSSLPKNTGARSSWIKSNPGQWKQMQDQFAKIDNWQNIQRGKRGLDATEGAVGQATGYGTTTGGYSRSSGRKANPAANPYKYKVGLSAGGSPNKPRLSTKSVKLKGTRAYSGGAQKATVSIKKSKV